MIDLEKRREEYRKEEKRLLEKELNKCTKQDIIRIILNDYGIYSICHKRVKYYMTEKKIKDLNKKIAELDIQIQNHVTSHSKDFITLKRLIDTRNQCWELLVKILKKNNV